VLLPAAGEHLASIRTDIFKYHICSRKSLTRWVGGIRREGMASKKIAEIALEHTPKAGVERFLLLMDKLYTSSMVSTGAIKQ
jgi:hypothetical protein